MDLGWFTPADDVPQYLLHYTHHTHTQATAYLFSVLDLHVNLVQQQPKNSGRWDFLKNHIADKSSIILLTDLSLACGYQYARSYYSCPVQKLWRRVELKMAVSFVAQSKITIFKNSEMETKH